jgi:hypothetical protein
MIQSLRSIAVEMATRVAGCFVCMRRPAFLLQGLGKDILDRVKEGGLSPNVRLVSIETFRCHSSSYECFLVCRFFVPTLSHSFDSS